MATQAHEPHDDFADDGRMDPDHDAFVRAKVLRALEESRDRSKLIPIEQVWRDLAR